MRRIAYLILFAAIFPMSDVVRADRFGTAGFAQRLNSNRFEHDRSFRGFEVIYKSSGVANERAARQTWLNSPPHRKLLPNITEVACYGNVCVGRGQ